MRRQVASLRSRAERAEKEAEALRFAAEVATLLERVCARARESEGEKEGMRARKRE